MPETLRECFADGLFTITLSRPPLNILNGPMMAELGGALERAAGEGEAKVLLIRAEGNDPALVESEPGYLSYDQRHVVKLNATAYLPKNWQIGGTTQWASGLPFSVIQEFDAQDNVGYVQSRKRFGYTDRLGVFQSENRNSHRNHAAYTFNVRARKSFVIGKAASVWASYHSTGKASVEDVGDRSAVLVVRGADPICKAMVAGELDAVDNVRPEDYRGVALPGIARVHDREEVDAVLRDLDDRLAGVAVRPGLGQRLPRQAG